MRGPRLPPRTVVVVESPPRPLAIDPEVLRFLQPQPPSPVPTRTYADQHSGLFAHSLLGHRVYLPGQ
jgi:hypothetical protein